MRNPGHKPGIYLLAALQLCCICPKRFYEWFVALRLIEQHLRVALDPAGPCGGDISRTGMIIDVEESNDGQEGLLEG